jgi:hypothetical protein
MRVEFGRHFKECFKLVFSWFQNSGVGLSLDYGIGYMIFGVRGCEVVQVILKLSLIFASKLLTYFDFGILLCIAWLPPQDAQLLLHMVLLNA